MNGPPETPSIVVSVVRSASAVGTDPNLAEYMLTALVTARASARARLILAWVWMLTNSGIAMAAKIPMIATTINSSMSVKPRCFVAPPSLGRHIDLIQLY